MKEEATCLHLRHVYDAIARRKVDIERCPGFRDTPRHFVRNHGLVLAPTGRRVEEERSDRRERKGKRGGRRACKRFQHFF